MKYYGLVKLPAASRGGFCKEFAKRTYSRPAFFSQEFSAAQSATGANRKGESLQGSAILIGSSPIFLNNPLGNREFLLGRVSVNFHSWEGRVCNG